MVEIKEIKLIGEDSEVAISLSKRLLQADFPSIDTKSTKKTTKKTDSKEIYNNLKQAIIGFFDERKEKTNIRTSTGAELANNFIYLYDGRISNLMTELTNQNYYLNDDSPQENLVKSFFTLEIERDRLTRTSLGGREGYFLSQNALQKIIRSPYTIAAGIAGAIATSYTFARNIENLNTRYDGPELSLFTDVGTRLQEIPYQGVLKYIPGPNAWDGPAVQATIITGDLTLALLAFGVTLGGISLLRKTVNFFRKGTGRDRTYNRTGYSKPLSNLNTSMKEGTKPLSYDKEFFDTPTFRSFVAEYKNIEGQKTYS